MFREVINKYLRSFGHLTINQEKLLPQGTREPSNVPQG